MALRRIVQSLGSKTFKSVYAARLPGVDNHPSRQQKAGGAHAEKDTYIPPQHKDIPHDYQPSHHNQSWETIKDEISTRPGGQQSQQPWMEAAKEKFTQATEFIKEKTANIDTKDLSKTAENLKEGAKEKLNQAADFLKSKTDSSTKDMGSSLKETAENLKEGAKDKLAQAQEFVRKQTMADSSKTVKAAAKEKYEDLKYSADQKKKITDEAWDFSKLRKGADLGTNQNVKHNLAGERVNQQKSQDFSKDESNVAGQSAIKQTINEAADSGKGILDSVKNAAANATEWVKDKFVPSGSEKQNLNAATDEKVQSASEKLKSEVKTEEANILKDSSSYKAAAKNFSDEKVDKKY